MKVILVEGQEGRELDTIEAKGETLVEGQFPLKIPADAQRVSSETGKAGDDAGQHNHEKLYCRGMVVDWKE